MSNTIAFLRVLSRRIFRLMRLIGHLFVGLLIGLLCFSPQLQPRLATDKVERIVMWWSRHLCHICHLRVQCYGTISDRPTLFVSNHISWLDSFAILGIFPVIFLAKQEIRDWFIIGWLVHRVGTLFITRGQFHSLKVVNTHITYALSHNLNVLFFPEGTSTDGTNVKRFHARIFQPAIDANVMIQPITLRYLEEKGSMSQTMPFINDDTFLGHTWRILGEKEYIVELWFCPPLSAHAKKPRELADYAQEQVTQVLHRQLSK